MIRYILLNPDDIHITGDEMICYSGRGTGWQWVPVAPMHHGDPAGEGNPCRRPLSRARLLKLADEAAREK